MWFKRFAFVGFICHALAVTCEVTTALTALRVKLNLIATDELVTGESKCQVLNSVWYGRH